MDFAFFASLNRTQAEEYLHQFLAKVSVGFAETAALAESEGLIIDYSPTSVVRLMAWVSPKLRTMPKPSDPSVPSWIRQTKTYTANLFEFTNPAQTLILRSAFYLGESFVRTFSQLRWGIGDERSAVSHMPVVQGFGHALEMGPLLVAENLYGRVIAEPSKSDCFTVAVQSWCLNVNV